MSGIDLWGLLANVGTTITAVAVMGGLFWRIIKRNTEVIVSKNAVSHDTYTRDRAEMWKEINEIKKFDAEFGVMKSQLSNVDSKVEELQQAVRDNAERQSNELTGGLERLRLVMVDFVRASNGR